MKLHHHAMVVRDMDVAIELYTTGLGMRLLRRKPGSAFREVAMMQDPATGRCVELLLDECAAETRFDHVSFEVTDVDGAFQGMLDRGCTVDRDPFDVAGRKVRTSFVRAPDGTKIELIRYA